MFSRNEFLEHERAKLETKLDEIHSELSTTAMINRALEEKFDEFSNNKSTVYGSLLETHKKMQQQLKVVADELYRIKSRVEDNQKGAIERFK